MALPFACAYALSVPAPEIVSRNSCGSRPSPRARSIACAAPPTSVRTHEFMTSLSRCPSPGRSPTQIVFDPIASNTGTTASRTSGAHPASTVSVPSWAGCRVPMTGASTNVTPAARACSASRRAPSGPTVALWIQTAPSFSAARTPAMVSEVAASSNSMVSTTSAPVTASAALSATRAPSSASAAARSAWRFQTTTSNPAFARFLAMPEPMIPVPSTATVLPVDVPITPPVQPRPTLVRDPRRLKGPVPVAFDDLVLWTACGAPPTLDSMRKALMIACTSAAAAVVYKALVVPKLRNWGATREEIAGPYPGAGIVPNGERGATMATTIDAPPEAVWPWLVQLGGDRGGWYSWDRLDNGGRPSADRIHPEWQDLKVGDTVKYWTKKYGAVDAWDVIVLEPNQFLGLRGLSDLRGRPLDPKNPRPAAYTEGLWAFQLKELPGRRTRLVIGGYETFEPRWVKLLVTDWAFPPLVWVMQSRMLAVLRRNAEGAEAAG